MSVIDILIKAASFAAIIVLGYLLRRKGFFKQEDFYILSKIVLKITLPAAIVSNFSGMERLDASMLSICLFGLTGGVLLMGTTWIFNIGKSKERKAFDLLNVAGYNIGNFAMPFVQGFLGPIGLAATSLFDTGNSVICLGGAYSAAMAAMKSGGRRSMKELIMPLVKSIPFDTYIIMTVLTLLGVRLPQIAVSFAQTIGGANAFMALLMVGVGFKISLRKDKLAAIFRILSIRYGISLVLALLWYNFAPFALEIRQAFVLLAFSPIASAAPAYSGEMNMDIGLSSAINSLSVVISILSMTAILVLIL